MKIWPVVLLLILIALAYAYFTRSIPIIQPTATPVPATVGSTVDFASTFIPYNDPAYNFSVQFPQVWYGALTPGELSYMSFTGPSDSNGNIESVLVFLLPGRITSTNVTSTVGAMQAQFSDVNVSSTRQVSLPGAVAAWQISSQVTAGNSRFLIEDLLVSCPAQSFEVTGLIPQELAAELPAVQYMLSTFQCT